MVPVKVKLTVALLFALLVGCRTNEKSKELATNVALSSEATVISFPQPLETPRMWEGEILVQFPSDYSISTRTQPFTLVSPLGKVVHVEVKFMDLNGRSTSTEITGFWGPYLFFDIPATARLKEIEITSSVPLTSTSVEWHVYDPREVKR